MLKFQRKIVNNCTKLNVVLKFAVFYCHSLFDRQYHSAWSWLIVALVTKYCWPSCPTFLFSLQTVCRVVFSFYFYFFKTRARMAILEFLVAPKSFWGGQKNAGNTYVKNKIFSRFDKRILEIHWNMTSWQKLSHKTGMNQFYHC